jgi:hypothetical protein
MAVQIPQQYECPHHANELKEMDIRKYGDPRGGLSKKVERVIV